jgi:hypothetical protein
MHDLVRRKLIQLVLLAGLPLPVATSVAAEVIPLAIKGYDPVAYFKVGKPVRGLAQFEYVWDEQRYRFSRVEHRELFKADPLRYAPQFANLCAMALARGEVVEANPEYWLIREGSLYIFGKRVGPELFTQDLERNIARAQQNRPRR